jgi:hypothetical protein
MRAPWKFATITAVLGYFVACAPVKFEKAPSPPCGSNGVACVQSCTAPGSCTKQYSLTQKATGLVDILIIDDNSGSMSSNQKKMANAFSGFLSQLSNLQYRIAITTTDISDGEAVSKGGVKPVPNNPLNPSRIQDGRLVDFQYNDKIFNPAEDADDSEANFLNAIERDETASCDTNYTNCPSGDERGVFAARLALERNEGSWIRPTAHMAVIVLSDEDERGTGTRSENTAYKLESYDRWENLMASFQSKFPSKSISVHPIVIKDAGCEASETDAAAGIRGVIGTEYLNWSNAIGGKSGSICDSNYASNLGQIATYVQNQAVSLSFECRPIGDAYSVSFSPQPAVVPTTTPNWTTKKLTINGAVPPNTNVTLTYECKD